MQIIYLHKLGGSCFLLETLYTKTCSLILKYFHAIIGARTKLAMQATFQKAKGQQRNVRYPQPEFNLGDVFTRTGASIDDGSPYCKLVLDSSN